MTPEETGKLKVGDQVFWTDPTTREACKGCVVKIESAKIWIHFEGDKSANWFGVNDGMKSVRTTLVEAVERDS